jgi:hypothetical protein
MNEFAARHFLAQGPEISQILFCFVSGCTSSTIEEKIGLKALVSMAA